MADGTRTSVRRVLRQLPFVAVATLAVIVLPAAATAALPGSWILAIPACATLSLACSWVGALAWRRFPQSRDVLFADLMPWGWLRRVRTEHRLAQVRSLLGAHPDDPVGVIRDLRALQRVTTMLESRDVYTRCHSLRVTRYSEGIAQRLALSEAEVARVRTAAALHDLGKFFTPREILNKPGRLTEEEFAVIKRHPADGAALLDGVVEPDVLAMIRHHHERLGGTGYPDGLAGDAIPLGARIIAVADTFDAMTSTRAYRSARPHERALAVLREEAGVALDPACVDAFSEYYTGRGGAVWSGLLSALTHALTPARELLTAGARALPAVGAAAALSAPLATGGATAAHLAHRSPDAGSNTRTASAPAKPAAGVPRLRTSLRSVPGVRRRTRSQGALPAHPRHEPASRPTGPGAHAQPRPATPPQPAHGEQPTDSAAAPTADAPASAPQPAATDAPAASEPAATAAPTEAPAVAVGPVAADVGPVHVETPPLDVDLPPLPVDLPPIDLPGIHLP